MNGYSYVLEKQISWAQSRNISLVGSQVTRGKKAYTEHLNQNLFSPLLPEVESSFSSGNGNELGNPERPGKMQAVHSSSPIAVNFFQHWKEINQVPIIAAACGLCRSDSVVSQDIRFEEKYPIDDAFPFSPNVDVVIHNSKEAKIKCFAIECKFSEAYGAYGHSGLKQAYLDVSEIWTGLSYSEEFARTITPDDKEFKHLHPAQLVKHIIGLKRKFGKNGFRFLYLWYDVPGQQGALHRREIDIFAEVAKNDGIKFHSMSYQELIMRLLKHKDEHPDYVNYLLRRYL